MRKSIDAQLRLVPVPFEHQHAREMQAMGAVLDRLPETVTLILKDLTRSGIDPAKGREGMSAEQVVRALVVKQMTGFSYEALAFHLADSATYRAFCRIGIADTCPSKSTLQRNIKAISDESLAHINQVLVRYAAHERIETGHRVRTDSTVVNASIHKPSDSSLLYDCVRVLSRLLHRARRWVNVTFVDHCRRAKRRALAIYQSAAGPRRATLYQDLLKVVVSTLRFAERAAEVLCHIRRGNRSMNAALKLAEQMRRSISLTYCVLDQTRRRVQLGESVPARQKIVSIFEPHVDVIIKDRRETLYGHKICLTAGASGLISDVVVLEGNPADATLTVPMMQRQVELYGHPPKQACFDGGFSSIANLEHLKRLGIVDIVFSKHKGMTLSEMVTSLRAYRKLRKFRAGVEGIISFLKRSFGLDRCTWESFPSFRAYIMASVLAANLLIVARHNLA